MPNFGPRLQISPLDNLGQRRAEILLWVTIADDEMRFARVRLMPPFFEVRTQLAQHRDDARLFLYLVLGLW